MSPRGLLPLALLAAPGAAHGDAMASIELLMGIDDTLKFRPAGTVNDVAPAAPAGATLGFGPAVEWPLGEKVSVGGELLFLWADQIGAPPRRELFSPQARIRLEHAITEDLAGEFLLAGGGIYWAAGQHDPSELGLSMRAALGASYRLGDTRLFTTLSSYRASAWPTSGLGGEGLAVEPLTVGLSSWMVTLGTRVPL